MKEIGFLLKISRPRFWLYVLGPYAVGLIAAARISTELFDLSAAVFLIYFTFPANLLIYGINDIADYETDKLNPKKSEYEALVMPDFRRRLGIWIAFTNIPFLLYAVIFEFSSLPLLIGFLFFSIFYSIRPIRAKAVPFLDSAFNILYVFPGIFAFFLISKTLPPVSLIIAASFWTAAMHAYSAVPDIAVDREANVKTIATTLGAKWTLILCAILYAASAILAFSYLPMLALALGILYFIVSLISIKLEADGRIFNMYRYFPILNTLGGFLIFWYVALPKLLSK